MTRAKWTTKDQEAWLEERKPAFLAANQKRCAAKEYFPLITKEFRDKWPVPPATPKEIEDAGSPETATRANIVKYDRRTCAWFHNNTRSMISNKARDVLKVVKSTPPPRKLQPWQAYHALTYESRWKPHVDQAWTDYKKAWEDEHPDVKPEKNRFQIMIEFMKAKFEDEDEEVKKKCNDYRKPERGDTISPEPASTVNNDYQASLDMLPRTLAAIGESLMNQTGWPITILAGGPMPDSNGMIMTFLSHTGKTKMGESFEQFLGKKVYDECLLHPFDKFLHAAFSAEDCASRSLVKGETGEIKESKTQDSEKDGEMNDDDWNQENGSDIDEDEDEINEGNNKKKKESKSTAGSKEQYPAVPDNLVRKPAAKKPAAKEKKNDVKLSDFFSVRHDAMPAPGTSPPTLTIPSPALATSATASVIDQASNPPQDFQHDATVPGTSAPTLPVPALATSAAPVIDQASLSQSTSTIINQSDAAESLVVSGGNSAAPFPPPSHTNSQPNPPDIHANSASLKALGGTCDGATNDATMHPATPAASPSPKSQNDDNLPTWLTQMIKYLRDVVEDTAWQDLVTEFVDFERHGPPNGNLSTKLRPKEVSEWIKSKKKEVVPSLNPDEYGNRFMAWWKILQPSWRTNSSDNCFRLFRDVPTGETWQGLRKGGKTGILLIIMGLSWWVKMQHTEHDAKIWSVVDDLRWVIQQIDREPPSLLVSPKRAYDGQDEDNVGQRKSRRLSK